MAEFNTTAPAEDVDSRTASISAKRPNSQNDDVQPNEDAQSGLYKRAKYATSKDRDAQSASGEDSEIHHDEDGLSISSDSDDYIVDIRENNGVARDIEERSNGKNNIPQGKRQSTAQAYIDMTSPLGTLLGHIPSMNDVKTQDDSIDKFLLPVRENRDYVKRLTQAVHKSREAKNRMIKVQAKGKKNPKLEQRCLHEAEVILAWCQYYPRQHRWYAPPQAELRKFYVEGDSMATKEANVRFFHLVSKCMEDGSLLDFRAGKFGAFGDLLTGIENDDAFSEGEANAEKTRVQERKNIVKQLKNGKRRLKQHQQSKTRIQTYKAQARKIQVLEVDHKYCVHYPATQRYQPLSTFKQIGVSIENTTAASDGTAAQLWKLIESLTEKQLQELRQGRLSHCTRAAKSDMTETIDDLSQRNDMELHASDDTGDGVKRGVHGSSHGPSGSASELLSLSPRSDQIMTNVTIHDKDGKSESGEISTGTEKSSPSVDENAHKNHTSRHKKMLRITHQMDGTEDMDTDVDQKPRVLSDLSPEDLNAQMRYFHFSKGLDDQIRDYPVRCLCCGSKGHMAVDCERLICSKCGAYNMHTTSNCDTERKCAKCKERGHEQSACPYKLKNLTPLEKVCKLCDNRGHFDEDCELFWRTSGAPWKSQLDISNLRIFCYECGGKGHLGNDCTSRHPDKSPGTSTWSLKRKPPPPPKDALPKSNELSIRGNASKRSKANTHDDDRLPVGRPQRPQSTRKGQIHIKPSVANSNIVDSSVPQWTPINRQPPPAASQPPSEEFRRLQQPRSSDRARYGEPPPSAHRAAPPPQRAMDGRPSYYEDRHRSPNYEADLQYQYNHQPPPPIYQNQYANHLGPPPSQYPPQISQYPMQPPRQQEPYRPLPSAARDNWNRYRM